MFEQFAPGTYFPIDSPLHRLRARTKLLLLVWLVGYTTAANQLGRVAPYAALVLLALLGAALARVGARALWRRMRWLTLLTLLGTIPAILLLGVEGTPWFALGPLVVTYESVRVAAQLAVSFLALYLLALLLTMTTSPVALIEGVTILLGPLRRLRLPVDAFALMALLALRFIPTLANELELLVKAQLARGADFRHGSLRARRDSLAALLVPAYAGALRRAGELATALEARGFTAGKPATVLYERPLARADYFCLALVVGASLGALLLPM